MLTTTKQPGATTNATRLHGNQRQQLKRYCKAAAQRVFKDGSSKYSTRFSASHHRFNNN